MNTFLQRYWKALVLMIGLMFLAWYTLSYTTIFKTSVIQLDGINFSVNAVVDGNTQVLPTTPTTISYSQSVEFQIVPDPSYPGVFTPEVNFGSSPFVYNPSSMTATLLQPGFSGNVTMMITRGGADTVTLSPINLQYAPVTIATTTDGGTSLIVGITGGTTTTGDTSQPPSESVCGDGALDAGEACDPPDGVSCDANCQVIALGGPICGDGALDAGEACDPPDGVSCDANCQVIAVPDEEDVIDQEAVPNEGANACSVQVWREVGPAVYQVAANSPASYPYMEFFYNVKPSGIAKDGVEIRGYEGLVWADDQSGEGVRVYVPLLEKVELEFWLGGTLHCLTTYKLDHRDTDGDDVTSMADLRFILRILIDALRDVTPALATAIQEFVDFLERQ
jgi:hypothetical protein